MGAVKNFLCTIFELWDQGYSIEEIGGKLGCPKQSICEWILYNAKYWDTNWDH